MFVCPSAEAKQLSQGPDYVLESSSERFGDQTLTLSKKGLRLDQPVHGLVYVAKPPDWRIFAFSPKEKLICDCGTGEPNCTFPIIPASKPKGGKGPKKDSLQGIAVTISTRAASGEEFEHSVKYGGGPLLANTKDRSSIKSQPRILAVRLYRAAELQLPKGVAMTASRLVQRPCDDGVPIQETRLLSNGKVQSNWSLTSWRRADVPKTSFVAPSGYKACSFHDLLASAVRHRLEDVGESFRLGEPFGTSKP